MNLNLKKDRDGLSKYMITATDNDGVEQTLTPAQWSKISGVNRNTIRHRFRRELEDQAKGIPMRDMRCIVGLEHYRKPEKRPAKKRKLNPVDTMAERRMFLYGKV